MREKKYFCYELYKNIAVWSRNGKIAYNPCSFYNGYYETSDHIDLTLAWQSSERKKLLDMVDQEIPIPGCQRCYHAEENGLISRRLASFEIYENWHQNPNIELSGPQGLDYSVGNLCNLKCTICGPDNSTQWIPDYKKLYPELDISSFKYQKNAQVKIDSDSSLSNLITIHFHGGGEPLMSSAHVDLLKRIKNIKGLADVRIFYNTNGTFTVDDEILKLWEQCKLVELYFSIDDIDHRFEYQRPGSSFKIIKQNLEWYQTNMPHNHAFKVNAVWGYLNLFYLDQLVDWQQKNFSKNRYGDPIPLIFQTAIGKSNINYISQKVKDTLLTRFSKYPELIALVLSLSISNQPHTEFLNWIEKIDTVRQQEFKKIVPEWAKLLNDTM